jgi:hypothetical protein
MWTQEKKNEYLREWRKNNPETPERRTRRLECSRKATLKYWERHPWARTLNRIRSRCSHHPDYVNRGIRCLITKDELRELWFRDQAYLMKQPSIDRIDTNGQYTKENCRYMEKLENSLRQWKEGGRAHLMWRGQPRKKK